MRNQDKMCLSQDVPSCYALLPLVIATATVTHPGESQAVDGISQHVSQQWWPRGESWIVGMHMGALPVYHLEAEHRHRWHQGAGPGTFLLQRPSLARGSTHSRDWLTLLRQPNKWHKSIKIRHIHSSCCPHFSYPKLVHQWSICTYAKTRREYARWKLLWESELWILCTLCISLQCLAPTALLSSNKRKGRLCSVAAGGLSRPVICKRHP